MHNPPPDLLTTCSPPEPRFIDGVHRPPSPHPLPPHPGAPRVRPADWNADSTNRRRCLVPRTLPGTTCVPPAGPGDRCHLRPRPHRAWRRHRTAWAARARRAHAGGSPRRAPPPRPPPLEIGHGRNRHRCRSAHRGRKIRRHARQDAGARSRRGRRSSAAGAREAERRADQRADLRPGAGAPAPARTRRVKPSSRAACRKVCRHSPSTRSAARD